MRMSETHANANAQKKKKKKKKMEQKNKIIDTVQLFFYLIKILAKLPYLIYLTPGALI